MQTTGPCSFSLTIVDENKRAIYYNEEFRDMIIKALAMKCRWQIQKFQPYADKIICFIDEPILSAFGSSTYVSVKRTMWSIISRKWSPPFMQTTPSPACIAAAIRNGAS